MKILLSFLQDNVDAPHPAPAYRFWVYYMKNGIDEAGMQWLEVPDVDWAEGLLYQERSQELKKWRDAVWDKTLTFIRQNLNNIDLFLTYLYPKQIDENAINEIKKTGIPCVNFYCDNVRQFRKVPDEFKVFDKVWIPEYGAVKLYKKAGISFINLPMPMWVEPKLRNGLNPSDKPAVSFIGSKDVLRESLLSEAISLGLNISIRGSGWIEKHAELQPDKTPLLQKIINQLAFVNEHGVKGFMIRHLDRGKLSANPIDPQNIFTQPGFDEYIQITQNSAITVGVNRVPTYKQPNTAPLIYSRLRDIEAPMLGACYVTEYCEGLEDLYDIENEILTYKTAADLAEKCRGLLKDQKKRSELRANGQKKALTALSIPASLKKLQDAVFK